MKLNIILSAVLQAALREGDPELGPALCVPGDGLDMEPRVGCAPKVETAEDAAQLLSTLAEGGVGLTGGETEMAPTCPLDDLGLFDLPLHISVDVKELVININGDGLGGEVPPFPQDLPPLPTSVKIEEVHTEDTPPEGGVYEEL